MKSLKKIYSLVGIVSLLNGGIILPQSFFSWPSSFKKQALRRRFSFRLSTSTRKKNKKTICGNESVATPIYDERFNDTKKLCSDVVAFLQNASNENSYFRKKRNPEWNFSEERDLWWHELENECAALRNQEFNGKKTEKKLNADTSKALIVAMEIHKVQLLKLCVPWLAIDAVDAITKEGLLS